MDRRGFIGRSAVAAGIFASAWGGSAAGMQPLKRPGVASYKLSLAAYSLRQYLQAAAGTPGAIDLIGFLDYCAKLGLSGAELTSYYFPAEVHPQYLHALKRHAHMAGLTISGGAIKNDYCQPPGMKLDEDLAHTEKWINFYADLGAPVIRIFAGQVPSGESEDMAVSRCIAAVEKACELAGKRGIILAIENHGGITARAETMLKIVQGVQSPWFGVNLDSGNFTSGSDPYAELAMIAPYAVNAQIKMEMTIDGKKQPADLGRVVKILRDHGYSGWLVLEYETAEDPYQGVPKAIDALRAAVSAT
jgi:sugar phosphate isomerase/epimerase